MNMVADDFTILNTQGIRFVEKIDEMPPYANPERYRLRVTYKGSQFDYRYPDKATRDAQYDALRTALTQQGRFTR